MRVIVDANIIISALLKDSYSRRILLFPQFDFYSPEYIMLELGKYLPEIAHRAGISEERIRTILDLIISNLILIKLEDYLEQLPKAYERLKDIDEDDVPYLAL